MGPMGSLLRRRFGGGAPALAHVPGTLSSDPEAPPTPDDPPPETHWKMPTKAEQPFVIALGVITASMAASAYHGYKRNDSIGWGLAWGALGTLIPILTPAVAVAQGFGKRAK